MTQTVTHVSLTHAKTKKANQWSNFNWRKPRAFRGHSRGIRGHSGSSKGIRVFQYCKELGFLGSTPGGSNLFIILNLERRSYWQLVGRKSTGVVLLEFYWRLSEESVGDVLEVWRTSRARN